MMSVTMSRAACCRCQQTIVQWRIGLDVLDQEHGEGADQLRRPDEPFGHPLDLLSEITGPVGMGVVIEIARIEYRVEQLLLGLEMVKQTCRRDADFPGDLSQRGVAPAIAGQQLLGHGKYPLPAVFPLGQERLIGPCTPRRRLRPCH